MLSRDESQADSTLAQPPFGVECEPFLPRVSRERATLGYVTKSLCDFFENGDANTWSESARSILTKIANSTIYVPRRILCRLKM